MIRVAAVTPEIRVGDLERNLATLREALADAEAAGARLIVAPELATSGYVLRDHDEARSVSLTREDPRVAGVGGGLGPGVVAVFGYLERAGVHLHNAAAVLTRDGLLASYRKTHLWGDEPDLFDPGDAPAPVLDTPIGRLGLAICYDNEFPEVPRGVALAGAEVLALPVNWPLVPRPAGEHPPETIMAMAAARASGMAVVIADRHGSERGVEWTGGTAVISAEGWIVAEPGGSGIALADVATMPLDAKAIGPRNDLFKDRRTDLYTDR